MVEGVTYQEQLKNTYVVPDNTFAAFIMQNFYDKVYKMSKEFFASQAYANLQTVIEDFKEA